MAERDVVADLGLDDPPADLVPIRKRVTDFSDEAVERRKAEKGQRDAMPKSTGAAAAPAEAPIDLETLTLWAVTEEQVEMMEATRLIWHDITASGHLAGWIGPAGAGKSAVARFMAGELAVRGFRVFYFQEDASAGDLPAMFEHAKEHGYSLLNSTLSRSTPNAQLEMLERMVVAEVDLSEAVLIFDTLKKYVDLMSKGGARAFFSLLCALTQRGATIVVLGHTNKHLGPDGKPVFEGVGDVRNDTDELIYLDATEKDAMGVKTITLRPDKTRCAIKPATFTLDTNTMTVRALDRVIDVQEMERNKRQREADADVIEAIDDALASAGMNRSELIERAGASCGHGQRTVRRVLDRYCSDNVDDTHALWLVTHMRFNNARHISRNPRRLPPLPNVRTA